MLSLWQPTESWRPNFISSANESDIELIQNLCKDIRCRWTLICQFQNDIDYFSLFIIYILHINIIYDFTAITKLTMTYVRVQRTSNLRSSFVREYILFSLFVQRRVMLGQILCSVHIVHYMIVRGVDISRCYRLSKSDPPARHSAQSSLQRNNIHNSKRSFGLCSLYRCLFISINMSFRLLTVITYRK